MSLRHSLSSASGIFAFEAAARLGSFTRAARELNITQPAVSHAIGALERHLGQRLFVRAGPKIELTECGQRLAHVTMRAFLSIEDVLSKLEEDQRREVVILSISSGMATHWLMPRYSLFKQSFPDVDLQFQLIPGRVEGPLAGCDLGLRVTSGAESKRQSGWFAPERVIAVGAPEYLRQYGSLLAPRQTHTLINLSNHWFGWSDFAHATGLHLPAVHERLTFSDYSVVLQVALGGQGLALAWTSVAAKLILEGLLVAASGKIVRTDRNYHFMLNPQRPDRQNVRDVCDWLVAEMRKDEDELKLRFG